MTRPCHCSRRRYGQLTGREKDDTDVGSLSKILANRGSADIRHPSDGVWTSLTNCMIAPLRFKNGVLGLALASVGLTFALSLAACGDVQRATDAVAESRPVTIMRLRERDFARETRLTGSVGLYRQQQVGFEVAGRLLAVLDVGREVLGPSFDEQDRQVRRGEVIAKLDDTRYRLRVRALDARMRSVRKELEAQAIDLDKVATANLDAAKASLRMAESDVRAAARRIEEVRIEKERAGKELKRQQQRLQRGGGRWKGLDDWEAVSGGASARVA